MCRRGTHGSFGVPSAEDEERDVDVGFLDSYAETQWEVGLRRVGRSARRELMRCDRLSCTLWWDPGSQELGDRVTEYCHCWHERG